MILRPLEMPRRASDEYAPAWPVVEHMERQKFESCWLITQPSHAALSGELAAHVSAPAFPTPDAKMIQAIALHDAGWGVTDAQAVQKSRSGARYQPESFLDVPPSQLVVIWKDSIETAAKVSPAGGYAVSRHFDRIARQQIESGGDHAQDRSRLEKFINAETQRQKKLAAKQPLPVEELERLTDLLQFADLLSLYLCSGAPDNVVFPEWFGIQVRASCSAEGLRLDPPIIPGGTMFAVSALRHPAKADESGREIVFRIE